MSTRLDQKPALPRWVKRAIALIALGLILPFAMPPLGLMLLSGAVVVPFWIAADWYLRPGHPEASTTARAPLRSHRARHHGHAHA